MRATAAYLCLYLAFCGLGAAIIGALLWAFFGGSTDPVFSGRFPA